jgi:hypothetical protein
MEAFFNESTVVVDLAVDVRDDGTQLLDGVEGEQGKASLRKQDGGKFTTASLSSIMSRIRALVLLEGHRSTDYHMSSLWLRRLAEDKAECREFFHLSHEQQPRLQRSPPPGWDDKAKKALKIIQLQHGIVQALGRRKRRAEAQGK